MTKLGKTLRAPTRPGMSVINENRKRPVAAYSIGEGVKTVLRAHFGILVNIIVSLEMELRTRARDQFYHLFTLGPV
jgi:hypothetical protein